MDEDEGEGEDVVGNEDGDWSRCGDGNWGWGGLV